MTKIKPAMVMAKSFDKLHDLCNLYIFVTTTDVYFVVHLSFVAVLLCRNLDSSMLKCEGSLSYLIKCLLTIPPINILNLYPYIFPIFKKFHPSPLLNKLNFCGTNYLWYCFNYKQDYCNRTDSMFSLETVTIY